jgi:hypothetical protein
VLRRMFGPKRDERTGQLRKSHSGELHNLYSLPNIIRQIKSRRMRWAGHVARMGVGVENFTGFWWGILKERDYLKDQVVDGRMGSERILGRLIGGVEWVHLAQDRDRWLALVNAVTNLRVLAPRISLVS